MGNRKQPTPPPTNQVKPAPPPAPPPPMRYDGAHVICRHGHRHGSIVAAAACDAD